MTLGACIALARDIGIALALGFIVWRIYVDGQNSIKVTDIRALQTQLTANAQKEEGWRTQANDASQALQSDLANVHAIVAQHTDPIVLRVPARCSAVPGPTPSPASQPATTGSPDTGSGVDLRPQISAFELRYEGIITDCRAALASWPR
jgi:hypothetical protein